MNDQPEPSTKRRRGDEPQADATSQIGPNSIADDEAVKAVSKRLASKKVVLAHLPAPCMITLPTLSEKLNSLTDRLKDSRALRTQVDPIEPWVDQPSVNFPESRNSDHARSDEASAEVSALSDSFNTQRMAAGPSAIVSSPPNPASAVTPSAGAVATEPSRSGLEVLHSPRVDEPAGSRLLLSVSHSIERGKSVDPFRTSEDPPVSISGPVAIQPERSTRADQPSDRSVRTATSVVRGNFDSNNPRIVAGSSQFESIESSRSLSAIGNSLRLESSRSLESASHAIRNPRSEGFRNLSMADVPGLDQGITGSSFGFPSVDESGAADGFAAGSSSEAGTIDLSRTNELLQQIVDAVRNQRGSSLPIGGPVVYADR